jgi:hypothetical protein
VTDNPLYANLSDPASGDTTEPGNPLQRDPGAESGPVAAKSEADIALKTIREICRREGHGQIVDISTVEDFPFRRISMCRRGCGTRFLDISSGEGWTLPQLMQALESRGMAHAKLDEASFILEPTNESEVR